MKTLDELMLAISPTSFADARRLLDEACRLEGVKIHETCGSYGCGQSRQEWAQGSRSLALYASDDKPAQMVAITSNWKWEKGDPIHDEKRESLPVSVEGARRAVRFLNGITGDRKGPFG